MFRTIMLASVLAGILMLPGEATKAQRSSRAASGQPDVTGTWSGSFKGKTFALVGAPGKPQSGTCIFTIVENGPNLNTPGTTFSITPKSGLTQGFDCSGQNGNNNLWVTGTNDLDETFVVSAHVDKKVKAMKGTGIIYNNDVLGGVLEFTISLKKQ